MLIECLMLVLVEQRAFTTQEMIDAVETAIAAKWQMIAEEEHPEIASAAAGMLSTLPNNLAASKVKLAANAGSQGKARPVAPPNAAA